MRIALISDIHANIHALQAVWDDLQQQRLDSLYCLGDLVGYGAYPNEVIEFIRERSVPTIMGNYDDGVGFDRDECGCAYTDPRLKELGDLSLFWTREHTIQENKGFLQSLVPEIRIRADGQRVLMVHGSPRRMNEYLYEDRPQATFERIAKASDAEVLLFGHTHLPYEKKVAGTLFVNTGSVGKPKDGDPRAGYVIADVGAGVEIEFRRVEYDVPAAARAIRVSQLPDYFADELESGGRTPLADPDVVRARSGGDR